MDALELSRRNPTEPSHAHFQLIDVTPAIPNQIVPNCPKLPKGRQLARIPTGKLAVTALPKAHEISIRRQYNTEPLAPPRSGTLAPFGPP
jgi:hypothetical protein